MYSIKKALFILPFFLLSFVFVGKANAANIFTGPSCSLVDAVLSAETNTSVGGCTAGSGVSDTIIISQNQTLSTPYLNTNNALPVITTNITINGQGNVVDVDQLSSEPFRVFEVLGGEFNLINLTFNNIAGNQGNVDQGGLLKIENSNLLMSSVRAFNFAVNGDGGLVNAKNTPIIIKNSNFQFGGADRGGVIFMDGGQNLFIGDTQIKNNSSVSEGGAISVKREASITIENSLFKQNASDFGAALSVGFLSNFKNLTIKNSEFEKNYSALAGAVTWGGSNGKISISGTTFFDNKGFSDGAAFVNEDPFSEVNIVNSTFSLNESFGNGGAVLNRGEEVKMVIAYSSFIENYSNGNGGAFTSYSPLAWNDSSLENNIFYQNVGGDCNLQTEIGLTKINNLSDDGSCGQTSATGVDINLENNGGLTRTHKLLDGSNAIDSAVNLGVKIKCPKIDQRGFSRMVDGNGDGVVACDIGAFEFRRRLNPSVLTNVLSLTPSPSPIVKEEVITSKEDKNKKEVLTEENKLNKKNR